MYAITVDSSRLKMTVSFEIPSLETQEVVLATSTLAVISYLTDNPFGSAGAVCLMVPYYYGVKHPLQEKFIKNLSVKEKAVSVGRAAINLVIIYQVTAYVFKAKVLDVTPLVLYGIPVSWSAMVFTVLVARAYNKNEYKRLLLKID